MKTWRDNLKLFVNTIRAPYPQYAGYYDAWVLAQAKRNVRFKGGSVLAKGRFVLASPRLDTWFDPDTGHDCAASAGDLIEVECV